LNARRFGIDLLDEPDKITNQANTAQAIREHLIRFRAGPG
jgi:hypothetical protein